MFPITDLSRADDIRMRRRRAVWLLVGIVVVPALWFSGHGRPASRDHAHGSGGTGNSLKFDLSSLSIQSDSLPGTEIESFLSRIPFVRRLDWMVEGAPLPAGRRDAATLTATGASLTVALPCANSIALVPQPDLSNRIFVSAQNRDPVATTGLRLTGGAEITLGGSCRHGGRDLVIQAPAAMALTLVQTGSTSVRLGAFSGPVRLTQDGSGDAVIDSAGPLDVVKSGDGDLSVGRIDGSLNLSQTGSGDTTINTAEAEAVSARLEGSGDLTIPHGHIGRVDAVLHGSGDLSIAAQVGNASVQASADSDVALPHCTGRLDRTVTGERDD